MKDSEKGEVNGFPPETPGARRKSATRGKKDKASEPKKAAGKRDSLPLPAYLTLVRLADWLENTQHPTKARDGTIAEMPSSTVRGHLKQLQVYHRQQIVLDEGGYVLTPAGEAIAALARTLFDTTEALRDRRMFKRPVLRLGGYNTNFRDQTALLLASKDPPFDTELIPAHSQEEMVRHLRVGITDIAFSYVTQGTTPDFMEDRKTFGYHLVGTYQAIPIASREHAMGNVDENGFWGSPEGFESIEEVAKNAERLIFDANGLPKIRKDIPSEIPLVLCDTQGTVTTLVRQDRGVGLIWDMPILLTEGIVRGRFKNPIRAPLSVYATWRNDVLKKRLKLHKEGDPMKRALERLGYDTSKFGSTK